MNPSANHDANHLANRPVNLAGYRPAKQGETCALSTAKSRSRSRRRQRGRGRTQTQIRPDHHPGKNKVWNCNTFSYKRSCCAREANS